MVLARPPHRPLSGPGFEATRLIRSGHNREWAKYVIGLDLLEFTPADAADRLADQLPA
jgi:hypothetical protein